LPFVFVGWRDERETPMNITGIGSAAVNALSSLSNPTSTQATTATQSASSPASSSHVSKRAELMSKLGQLLQQDPAKFKQVTQQISDALKSSAASAGGPQAQFLTQLSGRFAEAASSGSLASLEPRAGEAHEHGGAVAAHRQHHHDGQRAASGVEAALSTALDTVDQALSATASSTPSVTG